MTDAKAHFQELIDEAAQDHDVLGLYLGGSRGKGFQNEHADYDIGIILRDDATEAARQTYERYALHPDLEVFPSSLSEFRTSAALGSETSWARYSFYGVQAILDKTGEIQPLIDAKGRVPEAERDSYLRGVLDAYLNSTYRAFKGHRAGNRLGAKLEAVCGVPHLLATVFGLFGRHAPYLGYLERELRAYPLAQFPLSGERLLKLIGEIADSASIPAQRELFAVVERVCLEAGIGDVYESWGEGYSFMQRYPDV